MARKENNYFEMLADIGTSACECAGALEEFLANFDVDKLPQKMIELHSIENTADKKGHILTERLAREFITPIEQEDIMKLAAQLDDIVDNIEDNIIKIYMFGVKKIRAEAIEFAGVIMRCCDALCNTLQEFHNFRRSESIHDYIVEVNRLEEVGDKLYMNAMRGLYQGSVDAVDILIWTTLFGQLESCCDACENTADLIETIIMKNS